MKKFFGLIFLVLAFASLGQAQTAEVTVSLNEQFFDTLLDAIFKNFNAPEFPLAQTTSNSQVSSSKPPVFSFSNDDAPFRIPHSALRTCNESIRLLREIDGVKTAVRFRGGKIYAPIAFSGSYNPPLVGCIDFAGSAETTIDLEYDRQSGKLSGRVRVESVNLGGVSTLASGVLARLVQSSIDKKINPVEILQTDKLSFLIPIQNAGGTLKMKAVGVRTEISNTVLNVNIAYEFSKGN
ncbi:MAG: hypothetical protein ACR2HG_02090 [Pyrinomonadaceae bacterium]